MSDPRDVPGALEGGADRLHVSVPGPTCGLSPEPALVSAIGRESELPVFVLLRLNDTWSTTGGEFARLVGLAEDYLACGATGVAFGFLDADLEIDTETCTMLLMPAARGALDLPPGDRLLARPPPVVAPAAPAARPGGRAVRGIAPRDGGRVRRPAGDDHAETAPLVMPGGGLAAEHVPWLLKAGVRQLHLGDQVRPGGSAKAYVDAGYVRSWRSMVDDVLGPAAR